MALRPLLRHLADSPEGAALARDGGRAFVSASLRPYLVAAVLDGVDDALAAGRPALVVAGDDRQARDLAADLRHWLTPRAGRMHAKHRGAHNAPPPPPPPHTCQRNAPHGTPPSYKSDRAANPHPPHGRHSYRAASQHVP